MIFGKITNIDKNANNDVYIYHYWLTNLTIQLHDPSVR